MDRRPAWLVGVHSFVGWSIASHGGLERLRAFCGPHSRIPDGADWRPLDLEERASVAALIERERPSLVLYCAGICRVDKCERSPEFARRINVDAVATLLSLLPADARFVYLSSDHVFGGGRGPYTESSDPHPISVYGHTRVEAERIVRERLGSLIIRSSLWVGDSYDGQLGHLDWLRSRTRRGLPLTLVRGEHRSAVWAHDAARRVRELAESEVTGVRHVVARDITSRPKLAEFLDRRFDIDATWTTTTRDELDVPHLGEVDLRTEYRDALATPLESVG